ncbi:MAG: AraC family transcriptional regulator [Halanaerobiaceae bacterium]
MKPRAGDKFLINKNLIVSHRRRYDKMKPAAHYHNTLEVFLLVKGKCEFFVNDNVYKMKPGGIVLIDEYNLHKAVVKEKDFVYERFIIYLNHEYVHRELFKVIQNFKPANIFSGEISVLHINDVQLKEVVELFENIILEQNEKKDGYKTIIKGALMKLFVLLYRRIQKVKEEGNQYLSYDDRRLQEIIQYLNNNYKRSIGLQKIADKVCLNKHYLCNYFKNKTGFTVIEYINHKRIVEAQKLLESTSRSITDISFSVGFNSLTHFDRVFKEIAGITPSEFRKIKKN